MKKRQVDYHPKIFKMKNILKGIAYIGCSIVVLGELVYSIGMEVWMHCFSGYLIGEYMHGEISYWVGVTIIRLSLLIVCIIFMRKGIRILRGGK